MKSYKKVCKKIISLLITGVLLACSVPAMPSVSAYAGDINDSGFEIGPFVRIYDQEQCSFGNKSLMKLYDFSIPVEMEKYTLNSTEAGSYIIEFSTSDNYDPDGGDYFDAEMSVIYRTKTNGIWFTPLFNFTDAAQSFLKHEDELVEFQHEMFSIKLHDNCKEIIGLFIRKQSDGPKDNNAWKFDYMNVYKTTDEISDIFTDGNDRKTRTYSGELVGRVPSADCEKGYLAGMDKYQEWLFALENTKTAPEKFPEGVAVTNQYMLDILMGDTGFSSQNGVFNIDITYTDLDNKLQKKSIVVNNRTHKDTYFVDQAKAATSFFDTNILVNTHENAEKKNNTDFGDFSFYHGIDWDNSTITEIGALAYYFSNFSLNVDNYDNKVFAEPYSSFNIKFDVPNGIKSVEKIEMNNNIVSGSASAQAVTLYKLTGFNGDLYFNGGYSQQLVPDWQGYAIAKSSGSVSLNSPNLSSAYGTLINLPQEDQIYVDNRGTTVGFGVAIADTAGAGLDIFNKTLASYSYPDSQKGNQPYADTIIQEFIRYRHTDKYSDLKNVNYDAFYEHVRFFEAFYMAEEHELSEILGNANLIAYYGFDKYEDANFVLNNKNSESNSLLQFSRIINDFLYESLFLTIDYTDVMGNPRKVTVPFTTAYLTQSNADSTLFPQGGTPDTTLCGFANQGQELGLRVKLSQFESLDRVTLDFAGKEKAKVLMNNYVLLGTEDANEVFGVNSSAADIFSSQKGKYADEELSIRAVNYYGEVDKNSLHSVFEPGKGYIETVVNVPEENTVNFMPEVNSISERTGHTMTRNSSFNFTLNDTENGKFHYSDDLENSYIAALTFQQQKEGVLNKFGTSADVTFTVHYTNENGQQMETDLLNMTESSYNLYGKREYEHITGATLPNTFFPIGVEFDSSVYDYTYLSETGLLPQSDGTGYLYFEIDDNVRSIDAITFDIAPDTTHPYGDIWQINSVEVSKLNDMSQIYGEYNELILDHYLPHYYRNFECSKVAYANSPVMFSQENGYSKKISFITINEDGTENLPDTEVSDNTDKYLTNIPTSMTYEEVSQYLGLSVPKCEYTVNVNVADLPDAGSNNHFYFQLLFKNGKSAVVLANQQLAADGFRQGTTETFKVKTTQNYGELIGVKIICDSTSSDAQAFDKLNVASIDVLMTNSGIGKCWTVGNVGWVDIAFLDEAVAEAYNTNEVLKLTNSQISKDYPVTKSGNVIDLLFTFNFKNATHSKENVTGRLVYIDTNNKEVTVEFNLTDKLMEYVDGKSSTVYPYLNKMVISLTDVKSIKRIEMFSDTTGFAMDVESVTVEQVIGLGDLYALSSSQYERYIDQLVPITYSTNSASLSGYSLKSISFASNNISIDTTGSEWGSSISRMPTVNDYSVNMYLFGGTIVGEERQFTEQTPDLRVLINHRTLFNSNNIKATRATVSDFGYVNGKPCKYIKNFDINDLASIESLTVTSVQSEGNQPVLGYAYIEVVNNGVIVDTIYIDFANSYIINEVIGYPVSRMPVHNEYLQSVYLMLKPGQSGVLIPEENDVAVAFRYTSELDPENAKQVYQSPFVFLTDIDVKVSDLSKHLAFEVPFDVTGVDEIVGVVVQTTGPVVEFENAVVFNHYNNAEKTVKSVAHITDSFTASKQIKVAEKTKKKNTVSVVNLDIATPSEIEVAGAGYSGKIGMTLNYTDTYNSQRTITISDISPYISGSTASMGNATVKLLINNISTIDSVAFSVENKLDPWYISTVTVCELKEDGSKAVTGGSANNWVEYGTPLTVVFASQMPEPTPEAVGITSLTVDAYTALSGESISVAGGSNQIISVYPGDTVTISASVDGTGAYNSAVNWGYSENFGTYTTSGNTVTVKVPSGAAVDSTGVFTATCAADSSFTASVTLQVVKDNSPVVETQEYTISVAADGSTLFENSIGMNTTVEAFTIVGGQSVNVNVTTANASDTITWAIPATVSTVFESTASGERVIIDGNNLSFKLKDFSQDVTPADKLVLEGTYKSGDITHTISLTFIPKKHQLMQIDHYTAGSSVPTSSVVVATANAASFEGSVTEFPYAAGSYIVITNLADYGKVDYGPGDLTPGSENSVTVYFDATAGSLCAEDISDDDGTFTFTFLDDEQNIKATFKGKIIS